MFDLLDGLLLFNLTAILVGELKGKAIPFLMGMVGWLVFVIVKALF